MLAPILTFTQTSNPFTTLSSFNFMQSKLGSGALPILQGEMSVPLSFRLYNNFNRAVGVVAAMNVQITTYDGAGTISHTALTPPISQSWIRILQTGFGQNSTPIADLYTKYSGIDTAIGGNQGYYAQKGSSGDYGNPLINAGVDGNGVGYIEYQMYAQVPDVATSGDYNFVIGVSYSYTT